MSSFYVACDLGLETGRVVLGNLHRGKLSMSEVRRFRNSPIQDKESVHWNIPELYEETLAGLRSVATYEEPIESISFNSWGADYLLFESDGSLITPAGHPIDSRTRAEMKKVLAKVSGESMYAETGVQQSPDNTLFQLRTESFWRLNRAKHLLPIADGFNFLLAGVPRFETSLASTTQLYNPISAAWSDRLFTALHLPIKLFPPIVRAGTDLGALLPEIAKDTGLDEARVVTSCSLETAASLAGLPVSPEEGWAYLDMGARAKMGTELRKPMISKASHTANFTNEPGCAGRFCFSKPVMGLWVFEQCQDYWKEKDREVSTEMLTHLAGSATPFESLVNLDDPRFHEPGDMPLKIQAFCRETGQPIPRKPGAIVRCLLESLALHYRKTLQEIQSFTRREITRLYVLGECPYTLLNHFTANALQIPVIMAPTDAAAIGNVLVQAIALGHVKSLDDAREIARDSFKLDTLIPYATAWNAAYERLSQFSAA